MRGFIFNPDMPSTKKPCGVTAGVSTDIIGGTDDFDDYISTANQAFVI